MVHRMTGSPDDPPRPECVEVITSVQRRRRWTTEEKVRIVEETYLPGNSVSIIARRHGIAGNQLFTWRGLQCFSIRSWETRCSSFRSSRTSPLRAVFCRSWRSARGGTASTRGVLSGESDVAGAVASRRVRYQAVSLGISTLT